MEIHFAPLQGHTDYYYRKFYSDIYDGIDCFYTPFIRLEKEEPRKQDIDRLRKSADDGINIVPQIIFGSTKEFNTLTTAIKDLGFNRIDLNLGCPYPMQTSKHRGAALINNIQVMEAVADIINKDKETSYSIKMRLGLKEPEEWTSLMPVLNSMKLEHLTIHPRIGKQMYSGEINEEQFKLIIKESNNPIIWNGDILNIEDIKRIQQEYPQIKGIMIGRGLLARPSLAIEWKSGEEWTKKERLQKIIQFHSLLFETYENTLCGQTQILQKIKPFWEYLEDEIGRKAHKAIKKAINTDKYRAALRLIEL